MTKRMTEARWVAVLSATQRGIDEIHESEHKWYEQDVSECEQCRDAHDGLEILRHRYYETYLEPRS